MLYNNQSHSGYSLVENCDLLENRRTLMPFQRQANHSNFRIIDSQWSAEVFLLHYKAYFGKIFHIFIIQNK